MKRKEKKDKAAPTSTGLAMLTRCRDGGLPPGGTATSRPHNRAERTGYGESLGQSMAEGNEVGKLVGRTEKMGKGYE